MKMVVDTNVFVSSFFGGKPRKIIDLWFSGAVTLCVSEPILREYLNVLERFAFNESVLLRIIAALERGYNCLFVAMPKEQNWIPEDPADNKFIACAMALKADIIVSGDLHLKRLKHVGGIKIVTPAEMLKKAG